jgi:hypothetical protein
MTFITILRQLTFSEILSIAIVIGATFAIGHSLVA